jgi:hypothetical protein
MMDSTWLCQKSRISRDKTGQKIIDFFWKKSLSKQDCFVFYLRSAWLTVLIHDLNLASGWLPNQVLNYNNYYFYPYIDKGKPVLTLLTRDHDIVLIDHKVEFEN